MSDFEERMAREDRRKRWQATAVTWLQKAVAMTTYDARAAGAPETTPDSTLVALLDFRSEDARRWMIRHDAAELFCKGMRALEDLVPILNNDELDEAARYLARVEKAMRDRRRAVKLANVAGRTPEEAAAFLAKAQELSAR